MYSTKRRNINSKGCDYFIDRHDGKTYIIDENGDVLYETEKNVDYVLEENGILKEQTEDGEYRCIDKNGNEIINGSYKTIKAIGGIVKINSDKQQMLLSRSGEVLEWGENIKDEYVTEIIDGYYYCNSEKNDKACLYDKNGEIVQVKNKSGSYVGHLFLADNDKYFVVNEGNYVLQLEKAFERGIALAEVSKDGKHGL